MLIRSQDKERLMDFTRASVGIDHGESDENDIWITMMYSERDCGMLGRYSNEQKALKVLDMIQEAYADAKLNEILLPDVCKAANKSQQEKENTSIAKDIRNAFMKKMVFQMPEDRSVEV